MPELYAAPHPRRAKIGNRIGRSLLPRVFHVQVLGAEHVPALGQVILAANHLGLLDGPLLFGAAPRPANLLAKEELFRGPAGVVLRAFGQIKLDRTIGDRRALMTAMAVLERGGVVGVFPEGTRGRGDVMAIHQGAAWLALRSGAPVIPVACLGTRTGEDRQSIPGFHAPVAMVFGAPITLAVAADLPGRERRRMATDQLRRCLAHHVHTACERTGLALPDAAPSDVGDNG